MNMIPLTQGFAAVVDDADFEWLKAIGPWWVVNVPSATEIRYAATQVNRRTIYMHRAILKAPQRLQVDHENGNGLDNRRHNLRLATQSQNNANRVSKGSTTGFRGVYPRGQRFQARIWVGGQGITLGTFDRPDLAAVAYDIAAEKHFGAFARLNFPDLRQRAA